MCVYMLHMCLLVTSVSLTALMIFSECTAAPECPHEFVPVRDCQYLLVTTRLFLAIRMAGSMHSTPATLVTNQ